MPRILFIEDDAAIRFAVRDFLESQGFQLFEADSCAAAEQVFMQQRPSIVLTDYKLPDGTALDLLPRLRAISATVPIVVLTGHGTVELAVHAMRDGADDFLTKPVALPALLIVLERALERQRDRQVQLARQVKQQRYPIDPFLGESPAILRLRDLAWRVAASDRPLLLLGETGAGKGVLTRWIHAASARANEALVDLNCASLPRELLESELFGHERGAFTGAVNAKMGLVELAHRGTLFLDEIGDLELPLQPKLLKVLEEQTFRRVGALKDRQVDVRLIAATHRDLASMVSSSAFRSDLYFRISTIPLQVPPLRERVGDIPLLARTLLERLAADSGRRVIELAPDAERELLTYRWPGNIRELRNVLERAALLTGADVIQARDLHFDPLAAAAPPPHIPPRSARPTPAAAHSQPGMDDADDDAHTLEESQRRHIILALEAASGNVERAAARLAIPRSTLYQKIKAMQITVPREGRAT